MLRPSSSTVVKTVVKVMKKSSPFYFANNVRKNILPICVPFALAYYFAKILLIIIKHFLADASHMIFFGKHLVILLYFIMRGT